MQSHHFTLIVEGPDMQDEAMRMRALQSPLQPLLFRIPDQASHTLGPGAHVQRCANFSCTFTE